MREGVDFGIGLRASRGRAGYAVRTAAIFAWRLGGMRVAAGAFMFAIFDGWGRRPAGVAVVVGVGDTVVIEGRDELEGTAVVSIEKEDDVERVENGGWGGDEEPGVR